MARRTLPLRVGTSEKNTKRFRLEHIAEKDEHTNALPDGVGITIFQKV